MRSRALMRFNKQKRHMGGRCRHPAWGVGIPMYRGTAGRGAMNGMTRLAVKAHHCALEQRSG